MMKMERLQSHSQIRAPESQSTLINNKVFEGYALCTKGQDPAQHVVRCQNRSPSHLNVWQQRSIMITLKTINNAAAWEVGLIRALESFIMKASTKSFGHSNGLQRGAGAQQ
jgi:hypothetical protein